MKQKIYAITLITICGILFVSCALIESIIEEIFPPKPEKTPTPDIVVTPTATPDPGLSVGDFTVNSWTDYRVIITPYTIAQGGIVVEFDTRGYSNDEESIAFNDQRVTLIVQDVPVDANWQRDWQTIDGFLAQLQKLTACTGVTADNCVPTMNGVKFKIGSAFRTTTEYNLRTYIAGHSPVHHPLNWDKATTYHWKVIVSKDLMSAARNNAIIFSIDPVDALFGPMTSQLVVFFGGSPGSVGFASSREVTFSNISVKKLQ